MVLISQKEMMQRVLTAVQGNKFFTVTYHKDDGSLRKLNGRGRVRTFGVKTKGRTWNPEPTGRCFMWDRHKGGYRTVNMKRTVEATIDGVTYTTRGENLMGEIVIVEQT